MLLLIMSQLTDCEYLSDATIGERGGEFMKNRGSSVRRSESLAVHLYLAENGLKQYE